jgi:outer membrane protein insertion porin family
MRLFVFGFVLVLLVTGCWSVAMGRPNSGLKVRSVTIEGNDAFAERTLKKVLVTRASQFLRSRRFYSEVFETDLKNLLLFYQRRGYLEAAIEAAEVDVDSVGKVVDISIRLVEGSPTIVEGVSVFGNSVFSDELLLRRIDVQGGKPMLAKQIEDATFSVLTLYSNEGYIEARVQDDVRIDHENHRAFVDFIVQENAQYEVGNIHIVGLQKTNRHIVERELTFGAGDIVRYTRLLESQRRLYLTGLFESVFVRPQPPADGNPGKKDVRIELKEAMSIELVTGIGYGSVEKLRVMAGVLNNNIVGSSRKVGLSGRLSFINRKLEASFTEPWTFGRPWRTDINLITEYLVEPGFDLTRVAGVCVVGRSFGQYLRISNSYRYEDAELLNVQVIPLPERSRTNVRSLMVSLIFDSRDNLFNPARGTFAEWSNELAGSLLRGTNTFARTIMRFRHFHPVGGSATFASKIEAGVMDYFGASKEIPLNERFYAGGPNSLRGFDYRKVGPLDAGRVPLGGKLMLVCSVEIRRPVYKLLDGVAFIDAGTVRAELDNLSAEHVRVSPGLGLRFNTPIGIVRCDYGFNVWRETGETSGQVVVNMGQAF